MDTDRGIILEGLDQVGPAVAHPALALPTGSSVRRRVVGPGAAVLHAVEPLRAATALTASPHRRRCRHEYERSDLVELARL
jgi:hypothetical protein